MVNQFGSITIDATIDRIYVMVNLIGSSSEMEEAQGEEQETDDWAICRLHVTSLKCLAFGPLQNRLYFVAPS